jgi:predicted O-methyltransferase YrrM
MCHNYYVHHLISKAIDAIDGIEMIIELGTYWGSMSTLLALEGIRKQVPFHTFEIEEQRTQETIDFHKRLGVNYHQLDVLKERKFIIDLVKDKKCLFICDAGNKRDEFSAFAPFLKSGSIICAHDYTTEFLDEHIDPVRSLLEPFLHKDWNKHNSQFVLCRIK